MRKLPHYLEAALSFRSIPDLNKRYPQFFNSLTMGYECEVSKGSLDEPDLEVSYESMRREFEQEFNYDHDTFLRDKFRGAKEIIDTFEVEFMYGYAEDKYKKPLGSLLNLVGDRFSYKVMNFNNPETKEFEYVKPAIYSGPSGWRQFARDNKAENYDLEYVNKVSMAYYDLVTKFVNRYSIQIYEITSKMQQLIMYINEAKDNPSIIDDEDKLTTVYYIGKQIDSINNQFKLLYNAMDGTDIYNSRIAVLDENGKLVLVKMDNYEEGLLNPLVKDFDSDAFDTEYENAKQDAYDGQFEDFRENYETPSSSSSQVIDKIHDLVLSDVDERAEVSKDYHSSSMSKYRGKVTIVESDSSIEPPGAEIVSPILQGLNNSFVWLDKVFDMIDNNMLETNRTTGLHVNIGTFMTMTDTSALGRSMSRSERTNKPTIDMVKLALLSGDHYLLEQFDRLGNSYALSISSNVRDLASSNFDFKSMSKQGFQMLIDLNKKFIQGQGDRYRTINMQNLLEKGYIEFRIAGGEDYHSNKVKVKKAVYRYAQLCAIACDPQVYFKEYMTELYRLFVDNTNPADIQIQKPPRPKNVQEAMYIIRAWSSKYMENGNGALPAAPKDRILDAVLHGKSAFETDVLDMIAGIDTKLYSKVDVNFLYAIRLLMLYSAKDKPNPKQYLIDNWNKYHDTSIKNYLAPKMYRNKPQWLKFFFTGSLANSAIPKGTP